MNRLIVLCALLSLLATGCHSRHHDRLPPVASDRLVSIEVEIYDPVTNFVWENVAVRIVQADQEWSGCICSNPRLDDWYYTDRDGLVLFTAADLGLADVGFLVDGFGRAVLSPARDEDQASVLLEVTAPGLGTVFQEVDLTFDVPDVFVSIPF
jgi:hypothetical protein